MNKDKVLSSFFCDNSLNELAKSVGEEFLCPIIITDCAFHIVCSYSYLNYADAAYKTAVRHSELSFSACTQIAEKLNENKNHFWICMGENNLYVASLSSGGVLLGYILYIFKSAEDAIPKSEDFLFCESLLAKQLYLELHCCDSANSTSQEILEDLLGGKFSDKNIFDIQVGGTYLSHFSPSRFAVIDFCKSIEHDSSSGFVKDKINLYFHGAHPFLYRNQIILFIHEDSDIYNLNLLANEFKLKIIVSKRLGALFDMCVHYKLISDIFNTDSFLKKDCCVAFERDYLLLAKLYKQKDFPIDSKINSLFKYDLKNKSEFCLTLYNYFICSRSLKKTSQKMFTHSNTVLYRIQKAKNDFDIETDNADMHFCYLFSLACALLKLGCEDLFIHNSDTGGKDYV